MNRSFEFRFVTVLASHAESHGEGLEAESDFKALNDLGKAGWQIVSMTSDPQHPSARLMISLQRESSG
jgi:hypothetical protein